MSYDAARIAAQLARTSGARGLSPDEIAKDALELASIGERARERVAGSKPVDTHAKRCARIGEKYGARFVDQRDPRGMVFGFEFFDGSTSNGRSVFFLA